MTVHTSWRRRAVLSTVALACCASALAGLPAGASAAPSPTGSAAAATFTDDFDGPAGWRNAGVTVTLKR